MFGQVTTVFLESVYCELGFNDFVIRSCVIAT
jgi:hypothetical protein